MTLLVKCFLVTGASTADERPSWRALANPLPGKELVEGSGPTPATRQTPRRGFAIGQTAKPVHGFVNAPRTRVTLREADPTNSFDRDLGICLARRPIPTEGTEHRNSLNTWCLCTPPDPSSPLEYRGSGEKDLDRKLRSIYT